MSDDMPNNEKIILLYSPKCPNHTENEEEIYEYARGVWSSNIDRVN